MGTHLVQVGKLWRLVFYSTLASLLFLKYINDLSKIMNPDFNGIHFTDDASILIKTIDFGRNCQ